MPFPGCKSFATTGAGYQRGMCVYNNELYTVVGTTLYKVSASGATTTIGTISGGDRVVMDVDEANLVIAIGTGKPYQYDGTTLTQGTDADLPNANTVTYINDRMIYDKADGLAFADLNIPLTVNSANVLDSNTRADGCVGVITHRQQVYAFGSKTIEPSYFTGTGNPPYARINNSVQEIGTDAPYSIARNKEFIYFLGSDRSVYQMSGVQSRNIDNPAIGNAIQNYSVVSDAFGLTFNFDSQYFYMLSFPTEGVTWLYAQNTNAWTSLEYYGDGGASLIASYAYVYGKHIVGDRRNGNIYELDFDTYTDNSDVIQRVRTTREIKGKDFGLPDRPLFMSALELRIEPGTSLVTAESQIIMEYSDDNGKTWSSERFADIGEHGEFDYTLTWVGLGMFKRRIFRFTMSDAIKWVLVSCSAEVEAGLG